jgi:hypothetical protein
MQPEREKKIDLHWIYEILELGWSGLVTCSYYRIGRRIKYDVAWCGVGGVVWSFRLKFISSFYLPLRVQVLGTIPYTEAHSLPKFTVEYSQRVYLSPEMSGSFFSFLDIDDINSNYRVFHFHLAIIRLCSLSFHISHQMIGMLLHVGCCDSWAFPFQFHETWASP